MSFWGYSGEEEAYLEDKGRPVPQGEEGKRDCKGCASTGEQIKKTREGWQAVWGCRQGDKQVALNNSQAIHAGHDFSSSNQAETITL